MPSKTNLLLLLLCFGAVGLACNLVQMLGPTPTMPVYESLLPTDTPAAGQPIEIQTDEPPAADPPAAQPGDTAETPASTAPADPDILFWDDFSSPESGWDRLNDVVAVTEYQEGQYRIQVNTAQTYAWANPGQSFGDVIVEVTAARISGGETGYLGVICRYQDAENWYALVFDGYGYAAIRKRTTGQAVQDIVEWQEASGIQTDSSPNQLRAECIGDRLALYVNGSLVIETTDSDFSTGDIGLIAGTLADPSIEVKFDNLVVKKP